MKTSLDIDSLPWQELDNDQITDSELAWLRQHLRPEPFLYVYSDMGEDTDDAVYAFVDSALEGGQGRLYGMWHEHREPTGGGVGQDYVVVKIGELPVVATRDTDNRVGAIIRGGK